MGVPKFFRYTSERYPCLNELVKQYQIPDFDNMYLDMNGIIHNCSHPDDSNPHFRISEEKIFQDIFHYINILFQIIKPKKLFFMAIDGVAPRAKMNQQRGRRFRSAREAEKLEEEAKSKGEVLPTEKRFDSNCITPGTVFMARLHEQLKFFIKQKMSTDPLWSKVKVILSGHETPGEGEHKIMDYIRWARSQPDYAPDTRHCLYGLDADLIMLGMCTHEPHFALLREEVKFGKTTQRATSPEDTNFYLLHLSLLREYLEQEFISVKDKLPFPFDVEKIVDDWVLMGFLVGNDFIPHLPNMHISNDALPLLYKTYMTVLPTLDGYINEAGDLNLGRFEIFMQELAKIDKEKFQDTYVDLKYFEAKTGRRPNALERKEYKPNNDETFNVDINEIKMNKPDDELQALINATEDMFIDDMENDDEYEETSDEDANIEQEFILHKKDYYMNKLDYSKVTDEVLADQAEGYVRAIQWNLYYYYKGCPSWCWYYPHHYAPYISDIKGFKDLKIEFELGEPFKPFEQLLAVLPAASKHLLPAPFHDLMTDEDSPIVHYYPVHFETDLNGKRNDWEAVVLIPFIDETNLLSAMAPCYQRLTEEEHKRNSHGPMLVYNWTNESQGVALAPEYFPPIENCYAIEKQVWRPELDVPEEQLKKGILPNANRHKVYPGFPTMRHLKYKTVLKKAKVKVFDQPSRNDNMIVEVLDEVEEEPSLEKVAEELLGKVIWVGWPHLTKAKVISVSNETMRLHHIDKRNSDTDNGTLAYSTEANFGNLHKQWISERATILEHNMYRLGIEMGSVKTIIHAVNHKGYKYVIQDNVQMALEEVWCENACGYARQAIVRNVATFVEPRPHSFSTPQEAYPPGDRVFLLTLGQYYGCLATVVDSSCVRSGRIKVQVCERPEPAVGSVGSMGSASSYRTAHHAAAACGISTHTLSRITGSVLVVAGERNHLPTENLNKHNIGLNLKFNKKNQEVAGFTRRCKVTGAWLYSNRCIELVKAYAQKFPEFFDKLTYSLNNDVFFESDLWPEEIGKGKAQEIVQWLKTQPHCTAMRRECGSEVLEAEEIKALAQTLDKQLAELKNKEKKVTLHVKWSLLYKPELHEGNVAPDTRADFQLMDRVVCARRRGAVGAGAAGTVVGVCPTPRQACARLADRLDAAPTLHVMFDERFDGALTDDGLDEPRFYRMMPNHLLNISYGRKLRNISVEMDGQENSTFYNTPNILRKEDGHHSAFASYSPTSENKSFTSANDSRSNVIQNVKPQISQSQSQTQDNATQLLRNLLKISENESDTSKKPSKNLPEQNQNLNQNWRSKNNSNIPPPPPHRAQQQQNWRKENPMYSNHNNNRTQKPFFSNEWTNKNYKNQPPVVPPFPNFNQGPSSNQIPFPPFQNPHFQQRNQPFGYHGNQDGQRQNNQHRSYGNTQGFPKHLPTVNTWSVTLGPSWIKGESANTTSTVPQTRTKPSQAQSNVEKISNPFVPLQVQTSQRRHQNVSNPATKRELSNLPAPTPIVPQPQSSTLLVTPQQQEPNKLQKKKKPRIAANLPFQM